jgi:hypothetical protein
LEYTLSHILRQTMGTNNGKVTSVISNSYQYGEGETGLEEGLEEGEEGGEFHLIMLKH